MNLTEKHPAELTFHQMLKEIKSLLEKCENQFLDGDEKEVLTVEFKKIKDRLFDLQMERFSAHINERGKVENMPREEEELLREITGLTMRISKLINRK